MDDSALNGIAVLIFLLYCCLNILFWGLMIAFIVFWIWMFIDVVQHEFKNENDKVLWLLIVILVPFGDIVYFFTERKNKLS